MSETALVTVICKALSHWRGGVQFTAGKREYPLTLEQYKKVDQDPHLQIVGEPRATGDVPADDRVPGDDPIADLLALPSDVLLAGLDGHNQHTLELLRERLLSFDACDQEVLAAVEAALAQDTGGNTQQPAAPDADDTNTQAPGATPAAGDPATGEPEPEADPEPAQVIDASEVPGAPELVAGTVPQVLKAIPGIDDVPKLEAARELELREGGANRKGVVKALEARIAVLGAQPVAEGDA